MSNWDAATFEQSPPGTESVALGDDRIRELKREIRYRKEVEHDFGTDHGPSDNGRHRLGSARVFFQSAAPTALDFADYDSTLGGSGSGVTTLDDGRLWVDSNTFTMHVRDESNLSGLGASTWYPILGVAENIQSRVARTTTLAIDTDPLVTDVTWDGGAANPSVDIPATGTWQIEIVMIGVAASTGASAAAGHMTFWLTESIDGAAATAIGESFLTNRFEIANVRRAIQRIVFRSTVNGSTYTYGMRGTGVLGVGGFQGQLNGTDPITGTALETHLVVTARHTGG